LALCTMHHKLFRPRALSTLSENMVVIVSENANANGTKGFQEWVIAFHGQAIHPPQRPIVRILLLFNGMLAKFSKFPLDTALARANHFR
jgi:hypothetical protein